jgi:hypothetical protein
MLGASERLAAAWPASRGFTRPTVLLRAWARPKCSRRRKAAWNGPGRACGPEAGPEHFQLSHRGHGGEAASQVCCGGEPSSIGPLPPPRPLSPSPATRCPPQAHRDNPSCSSSSRLTHLAQQPSDGAPSPALDAHQQRQVNAAAAQLLRAVAGCRSDTALGQHLLLDAAHQGRGCNDGSAPIAPCSLSSGSAPASAPLVRPDIMQAVALLPALSNRWLSAADLDGCVDRGVVNLLREALLIQRAASDNAASVRCGPLSRLPTASPLPRCARNALYCCSWEPCTLGRA